MSEMVERGAAAMRAKRRELINQPLDRIWPRLMEAALESIMEPTDAMLRRGSAAAEVCDDGWESNATWMAMINAALEEPAPPADIQTAGAK